MKVWRGLSLLLWKNWLLQRRHPIQSLIEILAPVVFAALLVVVRSLVKPFPVDQIEFPPFNILVLPDLIPQNITANSTKWVVGWSPDQPAIREIMTRAAWTAGFKEMMFPSEEDFVDYMTSPSGPDLPVLGGVIFKGDFVENDPSLPNNIEMHLRFPSFQTMVYVETNTWLTDRIYPDYQVPGPRSNSSYKGGPPAYSDKGWLALQHAVSMSMIEYLNSASLQNVSVEMKRFPYPAYTDDLLLEALQSFVSLIVMLSFVYTCINIVRCVTTEKEKQLKESMKIMGLPGWLHWSAWFLNFFSLLVIAIAFMTILIKVDWYGTKVSVFTHSDWSIVFVFLVIFATTVITFSFLVSTFFSKANTAATIAGVAWFFSYAPYYFVLETYSQMSLSAKIATSLASNTAMAFGCQFFVQFEGTGEGVQWSNLFKPASPDDDYSLGGVMLVMILDSILYMLIAIYIEAVFPGDFGVPQPWYFPFQKSYWFPTHHTENLQIQPGIVVDTFFEEEPMDLKAGIQIQNLHKIFNGKSAVKGLTLNMYQGHITALLGHNGAGKTTTMAMLTGMLTPSAGSAIVGGCDIRQDISGARESLGLCPQHNILFDELTVNEHLRFFCKLKGLTPAEEEVEVAKYIRLLDFEAKANTQSRTLSGGMQRKLSVGVALCGGSKVVMLDEPTSGMDPSARRTLWDILEAEKSGRTLLLTTHFMDEADLLGDRIAIMSNGQLQCCGSSFFLKKKYGSGYQLAVARSRDCDVNGVTNILKAHVPEVRLVEAVGAELKYQLPEDRVGHFEAMMAALETRGTDLGVLGFGVSLTTMEEVFVRAGREVESSGDNEDVEVPETSTHLNGELSENIGEHKIGSKAIIMEGEVGFLYNGPRLLWNQFCAMMMKKILSTIRSWLLFCIQVGLPVAFLIIVIIVARVLPGVNDQPSLDITLKSYVQPVTVSQLFNAKRDVSEMYETYLKNLDGYQSEVVAENDSLSDYMIQQGLKDIARYNTRYVAGASFSFDDDIRMAVATAWFSNQPYHAAPLSLNLVHNALLKHYVSPERTLKLVNHPLPFDIQSTVIRQLSGTLTKGFQYAFNLGFSLAFVSSFYVLFYVRERICKSKHLQIVSGVRGWTYWLAAYLWDMLTFLGPALAIILVFVAFQEEGFRTANELGRILLILIMFAFSFLPCVYIASRLFSVPATGFSRLTIINTFLGVAAFMVVVVLQTPGLNLEDVAKLLEWIFMVFPHYNVTICLYNVYQTYLSARVCNQVLPFCEDLPSRGQSNTCCREPEQCPNGVCLDWTDDYFAWSSTGISRQLIYFFVEGVVLLVVVVALEYPPFNTLADQILRRLQTKRGVHPSDEAFANDDPEDEDVTKEKNHVRSTDLNSLNQTYQIVLRDMKKRYGQLLAVNDLCLAVEHGECFGLLGINGAGKTTTFKMLTGDEDISSGEAFLAGLSLRSDMRKVHQLIGYCPQFDALLDDLTGRETLTMFCLLRGIPWQQCPKVIERLAKQLTFTKHIDKRVKEYSGGNKRKLSTAVALVGDPPVVFLDEPTTGMDPVARRQLWSVVCKVRDDGNSIILTSHSMEECEALCTRLAVMVNGEFRCLGSPQYLKSKFAEGYTLVVKIKRSTPNDTKGVFYEVDPAKHFVSLTFKGSVLKEEVQGMLTYYIPWDVKLPWSKMFGLLERARTSLNIEDYSLGQTTLEQVFLTFTKAQRYVEE